MRRLIYIPTIVAMLAIGACDSDIALQEQVEGTEILEKHHGDRGADKVPTGYVLEFYYDEGFPEFTDIEIPCLGGLVRGEGRLVVEGTKINTPGGRLVVNWSVDYDETELWFDYIDAVGGDRINPGPEHDWVLVKGNQNAHDVAMVDEWNDDIAYSNGPGMHQFSMHEWYLNTMTGEIQTLNYPSRFTYDGFDGASLNITRYMDNGWCPGNSGTK